MKLSIRCIEPVQAHKALMEQVWPQLKASLISGHRMVLEMRPETRSSAENRLLHQLIGHIAAQKDWAGSKRDAETWKRLMVSAWCRTRGESVEILPALDGHGVDLVPARTSKLTRGECADLIEYVQAWAAMNDVRIPARIGPETGEIL